MVKLRFLAISDAELISWKIRGFDIILRNGLTTKAWWPDRPSWWKDNSEDAKWEGEEVQKMKEGKEFVNDDYDDQDMSIMVIMGYIKVRSKQNLKIL